jgi:cell division protein FtsI (penicillin-binding protein 3)
LGFTDPDGNGIAGLEAIYNKQLTSIPGWETVLLDARVRKIGEPDIKPAITNTRPIPASELILTFDNVIQDIVSRELQSAVELWNAKGGMALVMLPRSGEILAMASQPACDPNNANDFSLDAQREINVVNMYEPGSTFKIVPLLSALNNGLNLEQKIFCENGVYPVGSHRIRDTHPHGYLTLGDVLVYSSNIGAAKVCRIVGKSAIYQTARDLGFGCQTGVEVPSEARGILSDFHKWDLYQSCTIGYGQGVSVTALQLACAYGAIANDGILMKPRILRGIKSPGSEIIYTKPVQVRRIASRNVANQMLELLIQVVERGTGKIAKIEGAVIAGKTGTAQIPISKKVGYSETDYISTFIGFTVNEPRLLCLVIIDRPQFLHLGGYVSAPVFKSIMERAIPIVASEQKYHSAPSNGGGWVEKEFDIAPYLLNLSLADAKKILNRQKVAFKIIGSGNKITGQFPSPGAILLPQKPLLLYTDSLAELALVGLPARQAVKKALSAGYYPQIEGEGLVQSATVDGYTCHLTCSNN